MIGKIAGTAVYKPGDAAGRIVYWSAPSRHPLEADGQVFSQTLIAAILHVNGPHRRGEIPNDIADFSPRRPSLDDLSHRRPFPVRIYRVLAAVHLNSETTTSESISNLLTPACRATGLYHLAIAACVASDFDHFAERLFR